MNPPDNREAVADALANSKPRRTREWLNATYAPTWRPWLLLVTGPLADSEKPGKKPYRAGWQNPTGSDTGLHMARLAAHMNHPTLLGNIGLQPPPGVIVLDFDSKKDFEAAHAANSHAPAQRSANGGHLVFRLPAGVVVKNGVGLDLGDGLTCDVRAQGGYIVVAPSVHATGAAYEWIVPLPPDIESLPELPGRWASALSPAVGDLTQATQRSTGDKGTKAPQSHRIEGGNPIGDAEEIEAAIVATLPKSNGTRHNKLFKLARRLKAIPTVAAMFETRPVQVRPIIDDWYRRACRQKGVAIKDSIELNWVEFVGAWANIEFPFGEQLADAIAKAKALTDPRPAALADHLGFDDACFKTLVALCIVLSEPGRWPHETFPLPCRVAGKAVGVSHETARAWIAALVAIAFLEKVKEGDWGTPSGKASEYRVRPPAKE